MEFYRRNLPHLNAGDRPHFVTFTTYQRRVLSPWARRVVLDSCLFNHEKRYDLLVAVVMPDQAHMIFEPFPDTQLRLITRSIKSFSAHEINRRLKNHGQVWQEESFDHVLRSYESLEEKIRYVRENPVRLGLVNCPEDYEWSWEAQA